VTEPDPALGNVQSNYTYNVRGQLTGVSMPRGGTTQTRTFNYDLTTARLSSATNPETGTVSYVYNTDGTLASKTDAKGQCNQFTYDTFGRVTEKRGYQSCWGNPYQTVNYVYDTGVNGWGRLYSATVSTYWGGGVGQSFTYTPAGLVASKSQTNFYGSLNYTYDNEGRTLSTQYPINGPTFTYTYDEMGRPSRLTDNQSTPVDWVKDVAYNAAGQITTMSYARDPNGSSYYTETRQYNILQQLTRLTVPGVMDHEYRFSSTQNDGRITQRKDWVSGEEITYQYDTLNRLIAAQTTGPEWGQSFGYL
jgi:YD repeat-containing protein